MDYTTRFNSALKGRYYFLVIVGQDCKMRWSQNTSVKHREIVRLKVGDFAQQVTLRSREIVRLKVGDFAQQGDPTPQSYISPNQSQNQIIPWAEYLVR